MLSRKAFRGIAWFTLSAFVCFALAPDQAHGQEENPLLKAQGLYKQGNFIDAVKVLEAFIGKAKDDPGENKRLAEAYYLLARIYYDSGEDARVLEYMKQAVASCADIGKEEGNLDFKARLERVRDEWLKNQEAGKVTAPLPTNEKEKTEVLQPAAQEKEKPVPQLKKKKKFPWLLAALGVGVACILVVLISQITKKSNEAKIATYANGSLIVDGIRYELASIPAGEFQMGSDSAEAYGDEKPVHTVRISKTFWLGKTEVTQALWQAVMGSNPSDFDKGDTYPVETVSWDDCRSFITKLNEMFGGNAFRLPTEAEWEYACRAGTTEDRYGSLDAIAWYYGNSGNTTHPVGQKQANAWGLFDMLGNVWEWCQDWYGGYSAGYQTDPAGPAAGDARVVRGGTWSSNVWYVRSSSRYIYVPGSRLSGLGFRLARTND